jgi:hypothetical protein
MPHGYDNPDQHGIPDANMARSQNHPYLVYPDEISKYTEYVQTNTGWVSIRNPDYPPNSASGHEGRFNAEGKFAYYLASDIQTAKAEVPHWSSGMHLCKVRPCTITSFNITLWANDRGLGDKFLRSEEDGAYPLCQDVAKQVYDLCGISSFIYSSYQMHRQGQDGSCLALLPEGGTVDGNFFIPSSMPACKHPGCTSRAAPNDTFCVMHHNPPLADPSSSDFGSTNPNL